MLRRFSWAALFLFAGISYGQNSLPVQFAKDSSRNTQIGVFSRSGTLYGSLEDLAGVLGMKTSYGGETRKLELRTDQFTVKLTAGNPFVVVTDARLNASIIQFPANVLFAANSFYAPVDACVGMLNSILPERITFDPARRIIVVGVLEALSRFDVTGLRFEPKSNGLLVEIQCNKKLTDYESWLKPLGDETWLYVTLADAKADIKAISDAAPSGIVKQVLVFQSPASVQLTLKIKGQVNSTELIPAEGSDNILLAVRMPSEAQITARKNRGVERNLDRERSRWKLDVVVIDAGHGGDDPGTIGLNRTKEKDVALGIALKLGGIIQKNLPDVAVVYTRKTDEFVELYRRGQTANQAGGKLFISIHCNSAPRKPHPANGFEIYLLRPGKTDNAVRIAEQENAAIKLEQGYEQRYQQLTEENFILLTMAQNAYVKYSEKFADILQHEMGKRQSMENNGVKQAGFYVLVGASMPNVLVETGYLSNKHDEKILKSAAGQQRIAESIFHGVKRYKLEYEKSLQEGKDLGSRVE